SPPPILTPSLHDALPIFVEPTALGVLKQLADRVGRVLLVGADDARGAALDPTDRVLAGDRLAFVIEDAAAVVADQATLLVERDRSEEHTSELQSPDHLVC